MIKDIGDFADQRVCILGLGYVGLTLAVTMADVGFDVHGVEIRQSVLDKLDDGKAHFYEPGLEEKLQHVLATNNFHFSRDIPTKQKCSVYILTVGTPLDANGRSRLDMIQNSTQQVSKCLKDNDLVIMRSTIKLGVTRK